MPRTGARKNKDITSKEVEVKYDGGLPLGLLKDLAKFGVVPRIGFEKTVMKDTGSLRLNWVMGGGIPVNRVTTLAGREKTGKAQPLTAKIMTPYGWKKMGDINLGDEVINPEGGIAHVTDIFPQGTKPIYRIVFNDGSSTECCEDHLWKVRYYSYNKYEVKSLGDMINLGFKVKQHNKWAIQNVGKLSFPEKHLPIKPYLLGALLGDGCLTEGTPQICSADQEILDRVKVESGLEVKRTEADGYSYRITNGNTGGNENPLTMSLRSLGLMDKDSFTKFIPDMYLTASHEQRVELLQGLLDTDGSVSNSVRTTGVEYTTVSILLRDNVKELVMSLGGNVHITERYTTYTHKGEKKTGALSYRMYISLPSFVKPFYLSRKANSYRPPVKHEPHKSIDRVEYMGEKEAQCIMLDSDNHLYITDDYIVTHNTTTGIIISASEVARGGHVAYFDTENKFSYEWAESLGLDLSLFHLFSIRTGEQLINALPRMIAEKDPETGKPFFSGFVIDSVRGTMWDAEDQADAEAQQMGVSGKMWGKFARKIGTDIQSSNAWWLVINGLYDSMKPGSHEEIEPGGKGVPYMASLRLRTQPLVYGESNQEITVRIRCIHSQVGRNSKREGQYTIQYVDDKAIVNPLPDLVDLAAEYSVVQLGGGGWYSLNGQKWHGSPALQEAMQADPELYDYIYDNVMLKIDPNYVAPEKTYEEFLGEDHSDFPLEATEEYDDGYIPDDTGLFRPDVDPKTGEIETGLEDIMGDE